MELGRRLQQCREAGKVTQAEMASACGLSKNYISAMERGVNKCSAQTLISYAEKLDMSLDELVGKKVDPINPELRRMLESCDQKQQEKIVQIIKLVTE